MKPSELKWFLPLALANRENVMLVGAPGVGKTQLSAEMVNQAGFMSLFSHPVVAEPTDYKGFPFPFKKQGIAKFLPYANLAKMVFATSPLGVIIDDLGQAQTSNQAAIQQLIEQREVDGQPISKFVSFLLCTNSRMDKGAGVSHVLSTIMARCTIIKFDVDAEDWIYGFALPKAMPPALVSFIKLRPTMLFQEYKETHEMKNYPNPRNVARVGRWQNLGVKPESEYEVFAGCAGEQFAAEYCAHLKMTRDMPNPEEYIKDPTKPLPEKQDVLYALCTALAYMADKKNAGNVYALAMRMHGEFGLYMVKMMLKKNLDLAQAPGAVAWFEKNADFLL